MKRTAFIRCLNEEETVIATLMSIENIFNNIVIIHSDITDRSLEYIAKYIRGRNNVIVERYPHHVYPPLTQQYQEKGYDIKNSLAEYYNFGIKICKKIGGAIAKIDCDQVYLEDTLFEQFNRLERNYLFQRELKYSIGLWGINSFVHDNQLLIVPNEPVNGKGDVSIVSENMDIKYFQSIYYEIPVLPPEQIVLPFFKEPAWFHFRKRIMFIGENNTSYNYSVDEFMNKQNELLVLNEDLSILFENNIRPILKAAESPYAKISL